MGNYVFPLLDQWDQSPDSDELSGFANAGTGEDNVPATGGVTESWSNPSNITAESSSDAQMVTSGGGYVFPYLRASNFSFAIPSSATVIGIEAEVVWNVSSSHYTLDELRLAWGASAANLSTTDKGTGQSLDKAGGDTDVYGGAADMWGETSGTLTPSVINSSDFGFVLKPAKASTSSSTLRVDCMRMRIYYSVTEDGNVRVSQTEALVFAKNIEDVRVSQVYAEAIVSVSAQGGVPAGRRQSIIVSG